MGHPPPHPGMMPPPHEDAQRWICSAGAPGAPQGDSRSSSPHEKPHTGPPHAPANRQPVQVPAKMTGVATLRRLPSSARREELPVLQKSLPLRKTSSWSLQSAIGVAGTGLAKRLGGSWMEARAMLFCGRTVTGEQGLNPPPRQPPAPGLPIP